MVIFANTYDQIKFSSDWNMWITYFERSHKRTTNLHITKECTNILNWFKEIICYHVTALRSDHAACSVLHFLYLCGFVKRCPLGFRLNMGIDLSAIYFLVHCDINSSLSKTTYNTTNLGAHLINVLISLKVFMSTVIYSLQIVWWIANIQGGH